MLRLWLCGRVAAEFDGAPLAMPGSDRARALIGWLALHPGLHPRAGLYRWQLRDADGATDIELALDLPAKEAHRLPAQRQTLTESVDRLAALANAPVA